MLEAECMALRQMFANMSKNAQSVASNARMSMDSIIKEKKEGYSVHQALLDVDMIGSNQEAQPSPQEQDEAYGRHIF